MLDRVVCEEIGNRINFRPDDRKLINLQKLSAREKEKSLIPANIKYKTAWKAINNIKKSRCGVERQRNP